MTIELVKADKKPGSDLAQVNADLSNQERLTAVAKPVSYTHLTLPTIRLTCRCGWWGGN